jgi:hypothetical protein
MTKRNNDTSNNNDTRRGEKSELRKWQEGLPVEQATCRDIHHAWIYQSVKRDADGFIRRLACVTCGAFKLQHLDRNGYIDKSTYEYPDGYVRPAGSGRITADENAIMRILSINQAAQE